MPRPKRTKIVRNRREAIATDSPNLQNPEINSRGSAQEDSFGDDSDELVRNTATAKPLHNVELDQTMSGGLGIGDVKNAHVASDKKNQILQRVRKELREEAAQETETLERQKRELLRGPEEVGSRTVGKLRGNGEVLKAREPREGASHNNRGAVSAGTASEIRKVSRPNATESAVREPSNLPNNSSSPPFKAQVVADMILSDDENPHDEHVKGLLATRELIAAPSAHTKLATSSFMSLSNFKRRPRQPSILQMVQQSLANDVLADSSTHGVDETGDDFAVLTSSRSSTPSPQKSLLISPLKPQLRSSSSRKRKISGLDDHTPGPRSRSSLLQGIPPCPFGAEELPSDPAELLDTTAGPITAGSIGSNDGANRKTPSSPYSISTHHIPRRVSSVQLPIPHIASSRYSISKMHIPRRISSNHPPKPKDSARNERTQQRQTRPQRRPVQPEDIVTDASSPLSTPPASAAIGDGDAKSIPKKKQRKGQSAEPKILTTAALQAFLPRRQRTKASAAKSTRNEFDILSSSATSASEDEGDEDDDAMQRPTRRRRQARALKSNKATNGARSRGRKPLRSKNAATLGNLDPGGTVGAAEGRKTYSRRAGDKENAEAASVYGSGDEHEGVQRNASSPARRPAACKHGKESVGVDELGVAAKKFEEVDQWELEFESCDIGSQSSMTWR